jgi:hypothetical protein
MLHFVAYHTRLAQRAQAQLWLKSHPIIKEEVKEEDKMKEKRRKEEDEGEEEGEEEDEKLPPNSPLTAKAAGFSRRCSESNELHGTISPKTTSTCSQP